MTLFSLEFNTWTIIKNITLHNKIILTKSKTIVWDICASDESAKKVEIKAKRKNEVFLSFFKQRRIKNKTQNDDVTSGEADKETGSKDFEDETGNGAEETLTRDGAGISLDEAEQSNSTDPTEGVSWI